MFGHTINSDSAVKQQVHYNVNIIIIIIIIITNTGCKASLTIS